MDLNFAGNELYKAFNLVAGVALSSALKSVLNGVKVIVKDNLVELVATDLEVLIRCGVRIVKGKGDGTVVLPGIRVNNILKEWAGNENVMMSLDVSACLPDDAPGQSDGGTQAARNVCILRSQGGYFRILGEDAANFPEVGTTETKGFVAVDGAFLGNMVRQVVHAVSKIRSGHVLCGVLLDIVGDDIVVVAADGNRLSMIRHKVDNPERISMRGIVTPKSLTVLQRFVSEYGGIVKVGMSDSRVVFYSEGGEIVSQLIDGQYPKYEDVIPQGNDKKVEVSCDGLASSVRMASIMTEEGYRVVRFVLRKGLLKVTSKAADIGETEQEISVVYEGPDFEISFNPDYILDILRVFEGEAVTMEFGKEDGGALFTGHGQTHVVMPVELR